MPEITLTISRQTAPGSHLWHVYLNPGNGQELQLKKSTDSLAKTLNEARAFGYVVQITSVAHHEMVNAGVAPSELPDDVHLIEGWPLDEE